jgi:hypothetical protein
MGPAVSQSF